MLEIVLSSARATRRQLIAFFFAFQAPVRRIGDVVRIQLLVFSPRWIEHDFAMIMRHESRLYKPC